MNMLVVWKWLTVISACCMLFNSFSDYLIGRRLSYLKRHKRDGGAPAQQAMDH